MIEFEEPEESGHFNALHFKSNLQIMEIDGKEQVLLEEKEEVKSQKRLHNREENKILNPVCNSKEIVLEKELKVEEMEHFEEE